MATSPVSRAVLLNIGAFLADNNVRRNVGAFTYNFTSPTANAVTNYVTVNPGDTFTWNTPMNPSAVTFISCSAPLEASLTLAGGTDYSLTIKSVHLVDSDVRQVVFENTGSVVSKLVILQA
jgi:hypothetical protein